MKRTIVFSLCLIAVAAVGFADPTYLEHGQFSSFGAFDLDTSLVWDCLHFLY